MASQEFSQTPRIRTPKLAYRTKSSDGSSVTTSETNTTRLTCSTQPTSPTITDFSSLPSPGYSASEDPNFPTSRKPSIAPSYLSPDSQTKGVQKKSGFFSGLFSVREPSAQALMEYQRQISKQGNVEKRRLPTVGLQGISSASLPPSVPKVNSKWDGVPQTMKERERKKHPAALTSMSLYNGSFHSENSERSKSALGTSPLRRSKSRDTLGGLSTHSQRSQNRLADLYGWENGQSSSGSSTKTDASKPARPSTTRSITNQSSQSEQGPVPLLTRVPGTSQVPVGFEHSVHVESASPLPPGSPNLTPHNSSASTPSTNSPLQSLESAKSENVTAGQQEVFSIRTPTSVDEVLVQSAGISILGPPASAKGRAKQTPNQPSKIPSTDSPSTPNLHTSPQTQTVPQMNEDAQTAAVLQRPHSAQERLSLGMSLKHHAVPPWNWSDLHPETRAVGSDGERVVSPSPQEGSQSRRRKRLALFKR